MGAQVILVVTLAGVEGLGAFERRHDLRLPGAGLLQLRHIGAPNPFLLRPAREQRAAILAAGIGALAIELGRVMRDREEDAQQRSVGDHCWIVGHLHRFGMAGQTAAGDFIDGGRARAAGITRHHGLHTLHPFEHAFHAPEAAAGKHGLLQRGFGERRINGRGRGQHHAFGSAGRGGEGKCDQQALHADFPGTKLSDRPLMQ